MAGAKPMSAAGRALRAATETRQPATEPVAVTPALQPDTAASSQYAPPSAGERQKPVRITVDLVPELHAYLRHWAQDRGIVAADVMRQLVRELRDDPALRARVETEIETRRARVREAQRQAQA